MAQVHTNQSVGGIHRLFIANVSLQKQVICYRLDHDRDGHLKDTNRRFSPARQQDIEPGRQAQVGGTMHMMQITEIVEQLERYGLIAAVDVPRIGRRFHPYVYSIDAPVSAETMRRVRANNQGVKVEEGQKLRRMAAVKANEAVQKVVSHQFAEIGIEDEPADRTDVTFEQLEQSENGEKRIEEGYHVSPDAGPSKAVTSGRRGKKRRGR